MVASWPPTSGAMRTSVARTTPAIGGAGSARNRKYPPMHAASRTTPSPSRLLAMLLAMRQPPLNVSRRDHGKSEINKRDDPQPTPVGCDLPEARAQLIDTHDAVDRPIRGEDE